MLVARVVSTLLLNEVSEKEVAKFESRVFQTGGFPGLDLSFLFCPFLSFLGLSRFFWDFPDLLGDGPGIFPICSFPLSRPIKSAYDSPERVRDTIWTFPEKSGKHPGLETPPV